MSSKKKELGLINKSTLVASLGISSQAFDKWGVEPREKRGRENFYSIHDVVQNRVDNALSNVSKPGVKKPSKNPSIDQLGEEVLRTEKLAEEVRALKLKNDILEARSIPVDIAVGVLTGIISEQVTILETIPLLVKRHNPDMPSHAIDQIQRDISKISNIAATLGDKLDDTIASLIADAEGKVK
ncbi:terminase small subunit [Marinomonas spartinae]|uniref:terminase small subunit n=1 Tax=Marinomonas spartinae TaxID=1792290 RepID=UPI0018F2549A|nr:terminase small subunit [Marinomonas spartinae]MBJ7555400.1 terminase small subunit [Marinomonas spartinae]